MKSLCLSFICLLLNVGCGRTIPDMLNLGMHPYTKHKTDPIFAPYVQSFRVEFNVRVSVPVILKNIDPNKAGICYVWSDGYREVQINSKYWSGFSEEQKEQLVFHELGHCVFNFGHDDSRLQNRVCPNSIMRSFMFSQWEINNCYLPEYSHYMGDMNAKRR